VRSTGRKHENLRVASPEGDEARAFRRVKGLTDEQLDQAIVAIVQLSYSARGPSAALCEIVFGWLSAKCGGRAEHSTSPFGSI
jgi:hypothetical protein